MMRNNPRGTDGSGKKSGNLHEGLSRKNPPGIDSSGTRTGMTINNEPTRTGVGASVPVLGPREA